MTTAAARLAPATLTPLPAGNTTSTPHSGHPFQPPCHVFRGILSHTHDESAVRRALVRAGDGARARAADPSRGWRFRGPVDLHQPPLKTGAERRPAHRRRPEMASSAPGGEPGIPSKSARCPCPHFRHRRRALRRAIDGGRGRRHRCAPRNGARDLRRDCRNPPRGIGPRAAPGADRQGHCGFHPDDRADFRARYIPAD